ncbi:Gfo/Idh/MocA family protein [Pontiella agarivorans]|uniref:Gfo/Idh/MocA family oxidoreductase n=1 Tax=Pontiella agarivorans TaxID=3038953 RepID=A0ABU5MSA8_9BACT|nr:Gfo/Idh/MocA family oxidoreductase [Pontiella agarivorans]MDZ8117089.1 Gfo/Idh/MocA family oxidoreductase [Pontiella agarivorans]
MEKIRWGIIGCGGIANKFADGLSVLPAGRLYAGASRTPGNAEVFIQKHGGEAAYTDYATLAADPKVDAVYVATTHNFHFENVKLCLEYGKHVLCEKPMTLNARQAAELTQLAAAKELFLMEAMWTRFIPGICELERLLKEGVIGAVRSVRADFHIGGREFPKDGRLWSRDLAGGSLLDLGIYPITFADIVMGGDRPETVKSDACMGTTGVDNRSFYQLTYPGGRFAQLSSSFTSSAPVEAVIAGESGFIRVPNFFHPVEFEICRFGEDSETLRFPFPDEEGFKFEIEEAMNCIAAGKTESTVHPLSKTRQILELMDTLRAQWNFVYSGE